MDISLDTFPYAGTTTTVEALLMGVPVVTLCATGPQATHAQNVGVSLLTQVGCTELIANNEDQFVEIAMNLARSPERMRALRETLRQRLLASPLCDGPRYMVHVENQYRCMWRRYCEKEPEQQRLKASDATVEHGGSEEKDVKDVQLNHDHGADKQVAAGTADMDRDGGEGGEGKMEGEGFDGDMEREGGCHDREMEREVMKMDRMAGDGEQQSENESAADTSGAAAGGTVDKESSADRVSDGPDARQETKCRDLKAEGCDDGLRGSASCDSRESSAVDDNGGENIEGGTQVERGRHGGGTGDDEESEEGKGVAVREIPSNRSRVEKEVESLFSDASAVVASE